MRDLEDDLPMAPPQASPKEAFENVKRGWVDKRFRAYCQQCGRVVYASDSERQVRKKARKHERTMAKYADKSQFEGDRLRHAELMNPLEGRHNVVVRQADI